MSSAGLEVRDLSVRFGRVDALRSVSVDVRPGSVVGLIGPNGAGKTTLIDAVTGIVALASGSVALDGTSIERMAPHRRARLGLARTFQSLELFEDLSVGENLMVGTESRGRRPAGEPAGEPADDLGDLHRLAHRFPPTLSNAQRGRVATGRALAGRPRVLLLDEPAAGLDPGERAALAERIRRLAEGGLAVLVVDHDMGFVLELCDQVCVLDLGQVIAHGPPGAVRVDDRVIAAYLGHETPAPPPAAHPQATPGAGPPGGGSTGSRPTRLLQVEGLTAGYGAQSLVRDVDIEVAAGEVVALLGPNGAGKTTTVRAIVGMLATQGGAIDVLGHQPARPRSGYMMNGSRLIRSLLARSPDEPARAGRTGLRTGLRAGLRTDQLVRKGLAYVAQERALFPALTVRDHLRLATGHRESRIEDALARFPTLLPLLDRPAGRLSGGEQQLLALARALAGPHRLVVVDEVSLGLAPRLAREMLAMLAELAGDGRTGVLIVEQHAHLALAVADRAYVMNAGRVVLAGPAAELAADPRLVESVYLSTLSPLAATPARAIDPGRAEDPRCGRRVSVVGNSGAGKSTFATALAASLGVPHVELDAIFHQPGWTELAPEELRRRVAEAVAGEAWVVDGNYSAVIDLVWGRADSVVWLDLPRRTVRRRIVQRTLRRLVGRSVLWNGNRERWRDAVSLDPQRSVVAWAWTQHGSYVRRYEAAMADPAWSHLRFDRLTSVGAVADFLTAAGAGEQAAGPKR